MVSVSIGPESNTQPSLKLPINRGVASSRQSVQANLVRFPCPAPASWLPCLNLYNVQGQDELAASLPSRAH